MKNRILLVISLSGLLAFGAGFVFQPLFSFQNSHESMIESIDYPDSWKQVDSLAAQGLPQSALQIVNMIYERSLKKGDMPEFLKASVYQLKLRSEFEENYIPAWIGETEGKLTSTPEPARQILHSILADVYWQYYQQNRYRILGQTVIPDDKSEDIQTWDAVRFVKKTSAHYQGSMENAKLLQSVSLKMYDPVLITADGSKKFRPTLFDFLAHRAIDFFSSEEASVTRPVNPFVMRDAAFLLPPLSFGKTEILITDSLSFHFMALRLLKQTEIFHLNDTEPVALIDATLKRLDFVKNHINLAGKDSIYLSTLVQLEQSYAAQPVSADIIEKIARYWYGQNLIPEPVMPFTKESSQGNSNYITARNWCLKAITKYPESDGAKNCRVLLQSIEEPTLGFNMDQEVVPEKAFPVLLNFRNQKTVWFRLLSPGYDDKINLRQDIYRERGLDKYLAMNPVMEWNISLPETNDYQSHSAEVIMPAMKPGYYILLASGSPSFQKESSPVAIQDFWSTKISYISKRNADGSGLFFILDRSSGQPLAGVRAQSFSREYDYQKRGYSRRNAENYITGPDGSFTINAVSGRDYSTLSFDITIQNDRLVVENYFSRYRSTDPDIKEKTRTYFFTDRSVYRPGQIVFFKGIVVGTEVDINRLKKDEKSTVSLFDVNGQKVSSVDVISNEFGSFSGSFILPSSGLGGQFRIENNSGQAYFNVEEYKRPKFEVAFQPVTASYRLNEKVSVTGIAESYSGVPISDAVVNYRVVRKAYFPFYRHSWKFWPGTSAESEIINGTLISGNDGSFKIDFTAFPDPGDFSDLNPVYNFMVYADVTDLNGETRSSSASVQVSSKALIIGIDIPQEVDRASDIPYKLFATNLNGKNTPALVTMEIFSLKENPRLTRARRWNDPDLSLYTRDEFIRQLPLDVFMDENKQAMEKDKSVFKASVNTAKDSLITIEGIAKWEPGRYLITLKATDIFGKEVITDKEITVFASASKRIPVKQAFWANMLTTGIKVGEPIQILAGTANRNAKLLSEIQLKGKTVRQEWLTLSQEQKVIDYQVPEGYFGDVTVMLTMISDNRSYSFTKTLTVPDNRHQLNISFETFRSPLLPGGTEKWKMKLTTPDGKPVSAEMLAGMYDASLDAFTPHNWDFQLYERWFESFGWEHDRSFETAISYTTGYDRPDREAGVSRQYDQLNWFGYNMYFGRIQMTKSGSLRNQPMAVQDAVGEMEITETKKTEETLSENGAGVIPPSPEPQIRRNLNETAFFFPHLTTDEQGGISLEFTVPEALTKWKFMGLAHTHDLRYGQFTKEVITRKELMVTPNLPRFFREGDKMVIQTKVSNLTSNPMQGEARLSLFDAITLKPVDEKFHNTASPKKFNLDPTGNTVVEWEIFVPEGIEAVMVRTTAQAGNHSDGEEIILPVLTNRMLVTETLPLPVNGNETGKFTFNSLLSHAGGSTTLRDYRLTLEFTSNPAWYALQALPYLAEQTNESADQVFNRLYANILAAHIVNSNPAIRNVFETWKNKSPESFLSNLEKNQELKALLLEETPWLMEAKNEAATKQRIALLFELSRIAAEKQTANRKLQQTQSSNGGWPWFEGMPESRYITQLIVTGYGKLHYLRVIDLGKDVQTKGMIQRAADYLENRIVEDYDRIIKDYPDDADKNHLNPEQIQYLYAMSYLGDIAKTKNSSAKAIAYFSGQARKYWTSQGLFTQAMIALWAGRSGDAKTTASIIKSLNERAIRNTEMGMYWRDNLSGWYWYEAPVETQALLIELFEEFGNDPLAVDQMKTWLLKQKQTHSWATNRSTADAVYALLLRGGNWLQTDPSVNITLGDLTVNPASQKDLNTEAGTGYFKLSWSGEEIKSSMGNITVNKSTEGPAWGALYWQYFENLDKITAANSPLKISKQLFIKKNTDAGPVLQVITHENSLEVGQQVIVRVELRTDRDLEYIHLKDMRASGFEPVNTLSGYQWKGGLGYYENTRDAATNFFFAYLPKGTWVFEYPLRVAQRGEFSNGITSVQCMYAPEFAAHSEGTRVSVR